MHLQKIKCAHSRPCGLCHSSLNFRIMNAASVYQPGRLRVEVWIVGSKGSFTSKSKSYEHDSLCPRTLTVTVVMSSNGSVTLTLKCTALWGTGFIRLKKIGIIEDKRLFRVYIIRYWMHWLCLMCMYMTDVLIVYTVVIIWSSRNSAEDFKTGDFFFFIFSEESSLVNVQIAQVTCKGESDLANSWLLLGWLVCKVWRDIYLLLRLFTKDETIFIYLSVAVEILCLYGLA